jgi:glycosyltransferase involved in cell wall biosynthesis
MPTLLYLAALKPDKLGGVEIFCHALAKAVQPLGWSVVFCGEAAPSDEVKHSLALPNLRFDVLPRQAGLGLSQAFGIGRLVLRYRPDVLMYHLAGILSTYPRVGKLLGVKRVVYQDGTSRRSASLALGWGGVKVSMARFLTAPIDTVIAMSSYVEHAVRAEGIVAFDKIHAIVSGVDVHAAVNLDRKRAFWRNRYGISHGVPVILQVGWIVPEKGFDKLLEAAQRIIQEEPSTRFVMVGEGSYRKHYELLSEQLGIADHVVWTGAVSNPLHDGIYAMADVYCQLSQWQEACGFTVREAMAYRLPIVATNVGGLPEAVRHGHNGLVVELQDVSAIAESILTLVRDTSLRKDYGEQSRRIAVEEFNVETTIRQYLDYIGISTDDIRPMS